MHKKFTLLILCIVSGMLAASAQSLVIKSKDGTTATRQLGTVKRITFSGSSLLINYLSGPAENYSMIGLRSFSFKMPPTATSELELSGTRTMSIYPNPANDVVHFVNAPEAGFQLSVYTMNGVLMFRTVLNSGTQSVDLSYLPRGMYVLKTDNQAFKLIKR